MFATRAEPPEFQTFELPERRRGGVLAKQEVADQGFLPSGLLERDSAWPGLMPIPGDTPVRLAGPAIVDIALGRGNENCDDFGPTPSPSEQIPPVVGEKG